MYKVPLLIALSIATVLLLSIHNTGIGSPDTKVVSGFMIQNSNDINSFYIQDFESGDIIELAFENEIISDLTFEEFFNVEIAGRYDHEKNVLTVEEIIMLEENVLLEAYLEE